MKDPRRSRGGPLRVGSVIAVLAAALAVALFYAAVGVAVSGTDTIATFAGTGTGGYSGDGGPATSAQLGATTTGLAVDGSGDLYISHDGDLNQRIRKVDATTGIITTIAGSGYGFSGDGGPATSAQFRELGGIAFDAMDTLYIADTGNFRVRKVNATTGVVTTVAGNGSADPNFPGDGGPATSAQVSPLDVAVDAAGDLYIASQSRVRKVDATTGIITTVAGNGVGGSSGDGGPATSAQVSAQGVEIGPNGDLYITGDGRVRKVDATTGIITTVAGSGGYGFSGDGGPATSAQFRDPRGGVVFDSAGNFYVGDRENHRVRKVDTSGTITTIAGTGVPGNLGDGEGDGGPAASARLFYPWGLAIDAGGALYISEFGKGRVRYIRPDSDGDGILDASDPCPTLAEDPDGVQDADGCPEDPSHDVGVAGGGFRVTGGHVSLTRCGAPCTRAIVIKIKNYGDHMEASVPFSVTAAGGPSRTYSAECSGDAGPLGPGDVVAIAGCTVTYNAVGVYTHLLAVSHGSGGSVFFDGDLGNNTKSDTTTIVG